MSAYNPREGIDYLTDHYAVLGVPHGASSGVIRDARNEKMREYHEDRFQGLAPELLEQARRMARRINDAYATLSEQERRDAYDAKLLAWKGPISKDGTPIIDLASEHFSPSALLEKLTGNQDVMNCSAEELAKQFSGFNPASYEFFERKSAAGELSDEMKAAWIEQIARREFYLSLLEGFLWESIGLRNYAPVPKLEHVEQVQEELERTRAKANAHVEQQILALACGTQSLLPPPEGIDVAQEPGRALEHYRAKLDEYFEQQSDKLEAVARQHQDLREKRFDIEAEVSYHPDTKVLTKQVVIEIKANRSSTWAIFVFTDEKNVKVTSDDSVDFSEPAVVAKWMEDGYTFMSFKPIQGVDIFSQLSHVLEKHAEKIKAKAA